MTERVHVGVAVFAVERDDDVQALAAGRLHERGEADRFQRIARRSAVLRTISKPPSGGSRSNTMMSGCSIVFARLVHDVQRECALVREVHERRRRVRDRIGHRRLARHRDAIDPVR